MLWNDLEMEINICSKCNLERTRMNPIVGRGNKKAHIMFVMDDISEVEDRKEEVLVDKDGEYFRKFMEFSKFDIDDSYFTTLSKCSAHGELVSEETRLLCSEYLMAQIALVNPKYIIAVGEEVTNYFLPNEKITDIRNIVGNKYSYMGDITIIPIYDLSYLFKADSKEKWKLVSILKEL